LILKNTNQILVENHQVIDGQAKQVSVEYCGTFYQKNGKYYIFYTETEEGASVRTMVTIDGDRVSVKRSGDISSKMIYAPGLEHSFVYSMPYGAMPIRLKTDTVSVCIGPEGGSIEMVYSLFMQEESYKNHMKITVR
jgi:uncharacterized beta-barrel protein YwiB (DUF1934 family)